MNLDRIIAVRNNKTVYRDGDRCLKVFNEGYSKADVLNEALNQARIEETGLNIPRVLEVTVIDGKWTIVSDYIKGKTLAQIMQEEPENCDGYLDDMVELQLEIHSKKVTGISKLKDNLRAEIESLDVIDHIKRYDLLTRLDSTPKHVKLCHGNFGPENIVITDDNKVYIVDWIGASAGNASADVAKTYLKLALTSTETAEKYLNLFCKKTNTAKTYVQEWLPIMAASTLAKGVTSKEEKDLLFTWLDVVDYS